MKILFITPELPYPPDSGGRIRIFSLIRNLADRHLVSLISFDREPEDAIRSQELKKICKDVIAVPLSTPQLPHNKRKYQLLSLFGKVPFQYVSYFSKEMQVAIDNYLREHVVDIISVEFAQMGYYRLPGHIARTLDQHNVEYEILYRSYINEPLSIRKLYNFIEWRKFRRNEVAICRDFSMCLTTSERDKEILRKDLPLTRFRVIPNGVDSLFFNNDGSSFPDQNVVLFTGNIGYYPNTDATKFFVEEVLPLLRRQIPGVKFVVVGKEPPPEIRRYEADPGVMVTGYVDDTRDYFKKATVVVAPLRVGGGTRLKILEAMAMRKPVVATSVGAEGLDVAHGENILIADQPSQFAHAVSTLLRDEALRSKLAAAGRRLIEQRYDWKRITEQLETTYESLLNGQHTSSTSTRRDHHGADS
jgi:sugar transferase (PEP-CTERM/EpsH1 system associated)